jgi:DNA invertase Pin-like site-specific DNA recombinase
MSEKPMTVAEMARMGGIARAEAHSKAEVRAWSKLGGRKPKLSEKQWARLFRWCDEGKTQEQCAREFGISTRTVGRYLRQLRERETVE